MTSDTQRSEEISAGLCPRCAGTGRERSAPELQCSKCMGQGAVVIRVSTPPKVGSGELDAAGLDRDTLGRMVREAWVRWAKQQPAPKRSWLLTYDELPESDKEADRQIGETMFLWSKIHIEAAASLALTAPVDHPEVVGVKPLEWLVPLNSTTLSRCDTILGIYRVYTHHEANGRWFWSVDGFEKASGETSDEQTAKAAQADYETRIRSALLPSDSPALEVGVAEADAAHDLIMRSVSILSEVLLESPRFTTRLNNRFFSLRDDMRQWLVDQADAARAAREASR